MLRGLPLFLVSCLFGADALADWAIDRFEERHPLGDIETVTIRNPHGDIRVRTTGEDLVEITAIIQRPRQGPSPEIRVDFAASPAAIEVVAGSDERAHRVDLAVSLPAHAALVTETGNGLNEIKGRGARVEASTTNGAIYVSSRASVYARSEHGPVEIAFGNTEPVGDIETLTGDITAWLPRESDVEVEVATRAPVTTDYSISIEIDASGLRNGSVRLGQGRSRLRLRSTRGEVRLLRPGR